MEPPYCWAALAYVERNPARAGITTAAVATAWLEPSPWAQHGSRAEWLHMLADESSDDRMRVELQEATLSGYPLGQPLVERLEKELGRRFDRGKAGRPRQQQAAAAQASLFVESV